MSNEIEAYLNGELSAAARAGFEEKMAASPELRQDVADQKLMLAALRRKRVLVKINDAEGINFRRKIVKFSSLLLLLAVGAGLFFYLKKEEKAPIQPVLEQKKPETGPKTEPQPPVGQPRSAPQNPPLPQKKRPIAQAPTAKPADGPLTRTIRGDDDLPPDAVLLADRFLADFSPIPYINMAGLNTSWEREDFQRYFETIEYLNEKNGRPAPAAELAAGACLLKMHLPDDAAERLFPVLGSAGPVGQEAAWLLALSYVMQGKDEAARTALAAISGKRAAAAKRLLQEMGER